MRENRQCEISPASRSLATLRWIRRAASYCMRTVIAAVFLLIAIGSGIVAFPVYLIEVLGKYLGRKHKKAERQAPVQTKPL